MKKTILKISLCLMLVFCCGSPARAFVFSDVAALAQRAVQFVQTASHYTSSVTHFKEFAGYAQEFNKYKQQFEGYYNNFNRVYKSISGGRYAQAFNVSNWNWTRLDDHILRAWKTYNQASWDIQMIGLRTSRLFETNPAYRRYAERLIALSEEKIESIKKEEALSIELEERDKEQRQALEQLRATSAEISTKDDIAATELQVLSNNILLELAKIQAENNLMEQRRRRIEQELQSLLAELQQAEIEARENDDANYEHIFNFRFTK